MALGNNNSAIYLSIADGKIVRRFQNATDNSRERVISKGPNAGKVVHEEHYAYVEGLITDISTKESEYGKSWLVTIKDGKDTYVLQMDYSSGYSSAFLKALPNVDLLSKVKLSPKMTIEGDKKKTTLFVNQHGAQMKKIKVKGKEQWDDTDMMAFLENMVREDILPQLKAAPVVADEDNAEEAPF
jgi:hypothetical protein